MDHYIKVPRRTSLSAGFSFTLNAQTRAGFHSCRDLHFHLLLSLDAASAPAAGAGILYDATGAATGLAGSSNGKKSLLITNLAGAAAVAAVFRLSPSSRAV